MYALIFFLIIGLYMVYLIYRIDEYFSLKKEFEKKELLETSSAGHSEEYLKLKKKIASKKDNLIWLLIIPLIVIFTIGAILVTNPVFWFIFLLASTAKNEH